MAKVNRISVEVAMTTNKSPILFRVQPELRAWLERRATEQKRSLSNLIEVIVEAAATTNGYAASTPKKPRRR